MKSYLFTTANNRGGVILCNIDTLEDAVTYLDGRFEQVVRVEQGRHYWSKGEGYGELEPLSVPTASSSELSPDPASVQLLDL